MAIVAQLVRAPACGAGGRRFESGLSPQFFSLNVVVLNPRCSTVFLPVTLVPRVVA